MIIRDNMTRFNAHMKMSKMPKFDWTSTTMPSSLLLSPEGFGVEPYELKESCKEAPYAYILCRILHPWDMQDLLQSNQHLELT